MLGYVLPEKSELKLREYEIYSGYYCGICKYIGKRYGQLPRMALSYDAAFLALLLASVENVADAPLSEHCAVHHIKYKTIVRNGAIEYAGDVMLILAWFKLLDDARDEGKVYAKASIRLLKRIYKKLRRKHPALCREMESKIGELSTLENENCDSIDRAAEPFAKMMSSIFAQGADALYKGRSDMGDIDALRDIFTNIGYHMGKWIYLIDAVDDVEEDLESGSYNPLLLRFGYDAEKEDAEGFRKRIDEDLRFNLFHYLAVTGESLQDLDMKKNSAIIENIVYLGLNRRTEDVLNRRTPPKRRPFGPAVVWESKDGNKGESDEPL